MSTMQTYEGTKRLGATPMTRGDYNAYRGWTIPAGEDPAEPGYLVEYEDGGKANDSRHQGYISWSPADVFERTYRPVGTFQDRVRAEATDLADKVEKLGAFLAGDTFQTIPGEVQTQLTEQHGHMQGYLRVLQARIAAF